MDKKAGPQLRLYPETGNESGATKLDYDSRKICMMQIQMPRGMQALRVVQLPDPRLQCIINPLHGRISYTVYIVPNDVEVDFSLKYCTYIDSFTAENAVFSVFVKDVQLEVAENGAG